MLFPSRLQGIQMQKDGSLFALKSPNLDGYQQFCKAFISGYAAFAHQTFRKHHPDSLEQQNAYKNSHSSGIKIQFGLQTHSVHKH